MKTVYGAKALLRVRGRAKTLFLCKNVFGAACEHFSEWIPRIFQSFKVLIFSILQPFFTYKVGSNGKVAAS